MNGGILGIAFPALADTFQVDASLIGWIGIIFFLTSTSLLLTMGWAGDALGKNNVYTLGHLVFTVGMMLSAFSQNMPQLIAARAIQGAGSAMVLAISPAILAAAFPAKERGMAFGLLG